MKEVLAKEQPLPLEVEKAPEPEPAPVEEEEPEEPTIIEKWKGWLNRLTQSIAE
jgi:hypothetical protein